MANKATAVCVFLVLFFSFFASFIYYYWYCFYKNNENVGENKPKECEDFILDPISLPSSPFIANICFKSTVPQFLRIKHKNFTSSIFWSRDEVFDFQVFAYDCLVQLSSCSKAVLLKSGQKEDPFCIFVAVFKDLVLCYTKNLRGLTGGYLKEVAISARELDYLFNFTVFWFKQNYG